MGPFETFRQWRHRRTAAHELSRLNSRELADLGLARSQIDAVARKAY